ncbi:HET-domain-containing protein, partial [Phaeosphaeriaceae sp. SRC1lsM3a]
YLTLSHVWGEDASKQLRLSNRRLEEFQVTIPLHEMPLIFVEAMRIARQIGFKYLWIDSLCIIQDSDADWEAEASQMTTVYANAFCTIAFLHRPESGFDWPREPRAEVPCVVRRDDKTHCDISIEPRDPHRLKAEWYYRAWTFQEHLLSPRTIFYGGTSIAWECRQISSDELRGIPNVFDAQEISKSHLSLDPPQRWDNAGDWIPAHFDPWWALVNDYKQRRLTVPSDRVMAFAGVAEAFALTRGLTYLAGVWAESLAYDLLW